LLFGTGYKYTLTYLLYSTRYSTEYSSSKKLDSHSPSKAGSEVDGYVGAI